jgi:hypothetical protein
MEARAQYLSSRAAGQSQVLVRLTRMTSTPYRYLIRTRLCADSMFHLDFLPESPHLPRPQFHTGISSPPQLNFEWSFETAMSLHHEVKRSRHNLELSITYEHTTAHLPR